MGNSKELRKSLGAISEPFQLCKQLRAWQLTNSVRNKPGRGCKHKISRTLERKIVRNVRKKPQTCAKMIVADLASSGVDVSRNTVVRALYYDGLQGHRPRRTPLLKEWHITARLTFACEHLKGKDEFWRDNNCS
uniref:Transposase Tc1-like domain-containing protein n=1 Tax=Sparus aurata TaxID=8175 RepID=A0A671VHZ2_SPAAU